MPMGFSWSSCVAQAAAWAWLTYRHKDETPLVDESAFASAQHQLPKYIAVYEPGTVKISGFAAIYFDNLIVVSTSENTVMALRKRLLRNCAEHELNIHLKPDGELRIHNVDDMKVKGLSYLGVDYKLEGELPLRTLQVRPTRIGEWLEPLPTGEAPCREWAKFLGRALFAELIRGDCLQKSEQGRDIIATARYVATQVRLGTWDTPISCPGLRPIWRKTMELKEQGHVIPCYQPKRGAPTTLVVATDASLEGWGWVLTDGEAEPVFNGEKFESKEGHIFLKELEAAFTGLRQVPEGRRALLVVDNTAVAWALRQGFTRNTVGQLRIEQERNLLDRIEQVHTVISNDNPADCPSRGMLRLDSARMQRMTKSVAQFREGKLWCSQPHAQWVKRTPWRTGIHRTTTSNRTRTRQNTWRQTSSRRTKKRACVIATLRERSLRTGG
jgi:hypothetical protein